ncbi:MAG TPA: HAMP domain-containing sensor histidine kinase [Clostridia bacterium]|nr:HAMP domain-containing sensor histidine kinase [Clostridia bacterium]
MKRSGYKSVFHIYLIFFILLIGMIAAGIGMLFYVFTIQKPDGQSDLSNWPKVFTQDFSEQIVFAGNKPQVKQSGLEELKKNNLWLQVIDEDGVEVLSYRTPQKALNHYTPSELLYLYQTGGNGNSTVFIGGIQHGGTDWTYIIGFPVRISKVTAYLNADKFTGGKSIFIGLMGIMFLLVIISGVVYGLWITKRMSRMISAVGEIASRSYSPIESKGAFRDVYDSLNALDAEIKASDEVRERNEKAREEWIANITHDLKTPISPIKGYAELITDPNYEITLDQIKKYGKMILKNTAYAEELIDDLKLTYQLENEMIPLNKRENSIVRFTKEIVIDILNHPEYESRNISFYSGNEDITLIFDSMLLKRALNNLIYNALVHNSKETKIAISIKAEDKIQIRIQDNGRGMSEEELRNLFTRYYRGTNTGEKPEGSGLGMAIAKQIIELHGGSIFVESKLGIGTSFFVEFPHSNLRLN